MSPSRMKVLKANHPKGLEGLKFEEAPLPTIKPHECLIKIHAAGIIWAEITWDALYYDLKTRAPRSFTLGCDYAGVIEEVGAEVTKFKPGDEVYALTQDFTPNGSNKSGSIAEYTRAPVSDLAFKPKNLNWTGSAAVPLCALTAWQFLFEYAKLGDGAGKRVLITGAAGATGTWLVQLARNAGAHVACTASSPQSLDILRKLGAHEIVNYKEEKLDPKKHGQFDIVVDTQGGQALESCWPMVKQGGWITSLTANQWTSAPHQKRADELGLRSHWAVVSGNGEQLQQITKMLEEGKLESIVDKVYEFDQAIEAYRDGSQGHAHGKLVVRI